MIASFDNSTRFLVVDDFESMRKLILKNLNAMGYNNIFQAANGQEALRVLDQTPSIGVVITDWNMPVMTGIDLLHAIRAHEKHKRLPVLMITAEIAREQVQEAAEAGVSDFLVKPFTVGGLQSKLDKIMDNLKHGIVAGLGVSKPDIPQGGLHSALFAKAASASTMVNHSSAQAHASPPFLAHPPSHLPDRGAEPLALVITEDLQARMTRRANILVVDDVADNIDVLVGLLQDEYKVRAAKSGDMALKMLSIAKGNLPDLILLDVMMPGMDGFEVCRRLKAEPATAGIPVIFLTAADDATNVMQGFDLGAVDYVTKPANPAVLKARVRTHLTRSQAFIELQKQNQVMAENLHLREEVDRITAHDLKNPIGGIINFTDMLLADEMMTNDQKELLESIGDSAHTLLNMVNLSLDLFKIEQGNYELQPTQVDLIPLVRKLLTQKGPEIGAKKIQVSTILRGANLPDNPAFHIRGDELLCYSLFGNLIKNAVEASPMEGKLMILYARGDDGRGTVALTNSGAVPEGIRNFFFDKYVTVGKRGGTGLGTYSARMLAEVQQGVIAMQADDEKNETTLTVTLPLAT